MPEEKKYILHQAIAARKMRRMAYEILENNTQAKDIVLVGIQNNGAIIAKNMQHLLATITATPIDLITLSLNKQQPEDIALSHNRNFNHQNIILIDDVVNSGKTLLYALKPFIHFYPASIQVLVLVERSHKAFPIRPDYVGLSFSTTPEEHIFVETEGDIVKGAFIS
jgi:pyrimidine operon attenuation protein / uracil phosphoribosyltransferase